MADDTAALVVALSAQLTKFERDMDKAVGISDKGVRKIEARFKKMNPSFDFLDGFESKLTKLATGAGIAALIGQVKELVTEAAKIGEVAERFGITTDELQKLRYAFVATGSSVDAADAFINSFSNKMAEAAKGSGDLYNFLRVNNVAIKDAQGNLLPFNVLLGRYSDLVKNISSPQQQLNAAILVGGRNIGGQVVNALRGGAAAWKDYGDAAEKAGVIVGDDTIDKARQLDEEFKKIELSAGRAAKELAVSTWDILAKTIGVAASNLAQFIVEMNKAGQQPSAQLPLAPETGDVAGPDRSQAAQDVIDRATAAIAKLQEHKQQLSVVIANTTDIREIQNLEDELSKLDARIETTQQRLKSVLGINSGRVGADITSPLSGATDPRLKAAPSLGDGSTKQFDTQVDTFNKLIQSQERRIELLKAEQQSVGQSAGFEAELKAKIDPTNQAISQNIPLTAARIAKIDEEARKTGEAAQALDDYKKHWQAVNDVTQFGGNEMIDILDGLSNKTLTAASAMRKLAADISHALLQASILGQGPLAGILGFAPAASGGTGGLFGALLNGFKGAAGPTNIVGGAGSLPVPTFASGTNSAPGGLSLIGENGPELLNIPRGSQVIPNNVLSRMGGGGGPIITYSPVIDARGADVAAVARLAQVMADDKRTFNNRVLSAVSKWRGNTPSALSA